MSPLQRGLIVALALVVLGGCAGLIVTDRQLIGLPLADAERLLGQPALRFSEADGGRTLVYPSGPMGTATYFVRGDAAGRVVGRENVLDMRHFARIQAGMTQDEVLRVIGPPYPGWTVYFEARDELVWEWRYCDDWNEAARFDVLFDGRTGRVRSTLTATERQRAIFAGGDRRIWCSH